MKTQLLFVACLVLAFAQGSCAGADNGSSGENGGTMTPAQCESRGGSIMGDPGDGRIHRPDYRCPNGEKPLGPVRYETGDMIPVEGSVCCPG